MHRLLAVHHYVAAPLLRVASRVSAIHRNFETLTPRVQHLVAAYRKWGHLHADIDPLGLQKRPAPPELSLEQAGLSDVPLSTPVDVSKVIYSDSGENTLSSVLEKLQATYCGKIAAQFDYLEVCLIHNYLTPGRLRPSAIGLHAS